MAMKTRPDIIEKLLDLDIKNQIKQTKTITTRAGPFEFLSYRADIDFWIVWDEKINTIVISNCHCCFGLTRAVLYTTVIFWRRVFFPSSGIIVSF